MYNPQNAKETSSLLPKDSILDGVIIKIDDGQTKDFIPETALANWKGSIENPAINVVMEVTAGDDKVKVSQMFTYNDDNGTTTFAPGSNLGKYKRKYDKVPEVGDKVKVLTNSEGFGRIKLE